MPVPYLVPTDAAAVRSSSNVVPAAPASAAPPAPLSPLPADSFAALLDPGFVIPPDTQGAAGPSHLMVTLNSQVRIQDKTGGTISTVLLDSFWAAAGATDPFDPKVRYDAYGNRWIFAAGDAPHSASSGVLIGVSQTSSPTGAWNLYRIDADPLNARWADYPSLGFNRDWIVVQINMYGVSDDSFQGSNVYVFDKADLYAGGPGSFTLFTGAGVGGTQAPAVTYDNNLATMFLLQTLNPNVGGNGLLRLYTITGAVGAETLTTGPLISIPDPWNFGFDADFAPQLGSAAKIQAGDDRMLGLVYRNGFLWAVHAIRLPASPAPANRSSVQWLRITTAGSVVERGRIDDPTATLFFAFPSITVNRNNDVLIGYSRFSVAQYASGNYSFRTPADPPNTMQSDTVLKVGEATYFKDFGTARNRWGDYSSTVVDPVNDRDMWTIQEYAASPADTWGTWWGRIAPECGNGSLDAGEECDDGNSIATDGCTNNCTVCGNSTVTAPEQCDDGDLVDGNGCDSNCTFTGCGNGIVTSGELCDDGNLVDNDGCDANCTPTACGNGIVTPGELCDDGDLTSGDGCDANCTPTGCGNGIITSGESCDDGNLTSGDGCDANCTPTGCGNGIATSGESCDDGNLVDGDGCQSDCTPTPMHDAVVLPKGPLKVTIRAGKISVLKTLKIKVRNADTTPGVSQTVQLAVADNCPAGTLMVGAPDFDLRTPGAQSSASLLSGASKAAAIALTITNNFVTFNSAAPTRCTLTFTANVPVPGNVDPTPSNNTLPVELNVIDATDTQMMTLHESLAVSAKPVKVAVGKGKASKVKNAKISVSNADILPVPEMPGDLITVSVSDGDCPPGTVGVVDYDRAIPGSQNLATVAGGDAVRGTLPLTINAGAFTTANNKSPNRCTAQISAAGPGGDTDASNNTTQLVIDVIDKNDF